MSEFVKINYHQGKNFTGDALFDKAENNGNKYQSGIVVFTQENKTQNIERTNLYENLGVSFSSAKSLKLPVQNPEFVAASEYYNNQLEVYERGNVTQKAYSNLEERLYKMEKGIDDAFIDCQAYQDIVIVPRWHYRYYPYVNDKLMQFDIEEIRNITAKDMQSLQDLKERIECVIAEANGEENYQKPEPTHYDIEELAQKHLGMTYADFAKLYKDELEFCKTVSSADLNAMNETQRMVYSKAKAYAAEMIQTTINEAHTTNWDAGNRKVDETMKATDDMLLLSDFETDGITEEGLSQIKSGILYKAFEDAVIEKYKTSCIDNISKQTSQQASVKNIKKFNARNKRVEIQSGAFIYDTNGKRIQ